MDNRLQPPPCSVQTSNKASGSVYPQDGTEAENYQNYHIINYQIITIIKLPIVNYQNKMSNVEWTALDIMFRMDRIKRRFKYEHY